MRIAMFGGTFDPFHKGHEAIARYLLASGKVQRILLIPAPNPPHKTDRDISPYADRRKMLELASADIPGTEICDIECERGGKSYSLDTLHELSARYPGDEILLLIGGDSLATLHLWYHAREIVKEYTVLTYPRKDCRIDPQALSEHWQPDELKKLSDGILSDAPVVPVSASELRLALKRGDGSLDHYLAPAVLNWIQQHHYYKEPANG